MLRGSGPAHPPTAVRGLQQRAPHRTQILSALPPRCKRCRDEQCGGALLRGVCVRARARAREAQVLLGPILGGTSSRVLLKFATSPEGMTSCPLHNLVEMRSLRTGAQFNILRAHANPEFRCRVLKIKKKMQSSR